jgi:hypothetical protein
MSVFALGLLAACSSPAPAVRTVVVRETVVVTIPRQKTQPTDTLTVEPKPPAEPSVTPSPEPKPTETVTPTPVPFIRYIPGSSQKVCQLTGETDREFGKPTVNQTETRWGLVSVDVGYSFEHDGKLFFIFGDANPTAMFNGKPNGPNDPPRRWDDNDGPIAFTTATNIDNCLKLGVVTDSIGAYKNPIVLNAQGQPAIELRIDEAPISGFSQAGRMYVFFMTDNYVYPSPGPTSSDLGMSTRSVLAVSDDDGRTFHYLYDFSKRPESKFVSDVEIAHGTDGYLYFWGTQGGKLYRKSPAYFARKPASAIDQPGGLEYFAGLDANGQPHFSALEADAAPLFHDYNQNTTGQRQMADCIGEFGVEWNNFIHRWVMLYNCGDQTKQNTPGIYLRVASEPWGPWSEPVTVFDAWRDKGYCHFMHAVVNPPCDSMNEPGEAGMWGGAYGPYFISRFTTGDAASGITTFYYTLSTWEPYQKIIMKSTIQSSP